LYDPGSQRFELNNLQDWQHATMYAAFLASGLVDLIGHYAPRGTLPAGLEHVRMRPLSPAVLVLHEHAAACAQSSRSWCSSRGKHIACLLCMQEACVQHA
jgi:hypothetical protein